MLNTYYSTIVHTCRFGSGNFSLLCLSAGLFSDIANCNGEDKLVDAEVDTAIGTTGAAILVKSNNREKVEFFGKDIDFAEESLCRKCFEGGVWVSLDGVLTTESSADSMLARHHVAKEHI